MDLGKRRCLDADRALNAFQKIPISPPNALAKANLGRLQFVGDA